MRIAVCTCSVRTVAGTRSCFREGAGAKSTFRVFRAPAGVVTGRAVPALTFQLRITNSDPELLRLGAVERSPAAPRLLLGLTNFSYPSYDFFITLSAARQSLAAMSTRCRGVAERDCPAPHAGHKMEDLRCGRWCPGCCHAERRKLEWQFQLQTGKKWSVSFILPMIVTVLFSKY